MQPCASMGTIPGIDRVLHSVQEMFGYLDDEAFRFIASSLHVPLSSVWCGNLYHFSK